MRAETPVASANSVNTSEKTVSEAASFQTAALDTAYAATQPAIPPASATHVSAGPDNVVRLPAGVDLNEITVSGDDLVIQLPDGTVLVIDNGAANPPELIIDGVSIPAVNVAALLGEQEVEPAAGTPSSSGGNFAQEVGDIGPGIGIGDLLPPTALAFSPPEYEELYVEIKDNEPTVIIITPDLPVGAPDVIQSTSDAGLEGGTAEGSGSDETSGTITFTPGDEPSTVTIDGIVVAVGVIINSEHGFLEITSVAPGEIGYIFHQTENVLHPPGSDDIFEETFEVVVTDADGDTASGTLTITIMDDFPTAHADMDSVTEDGPLTADGNVITASGGVDANATDGVADFTGADAPVNVTGVAAGSLTSASGNVGANVAGTYGTLTLNANGSYTYTLNNANAAVQGLDTGETLQDVFTYTITDADDDSSSTTLTITINGANDAPTVGNSTAVVSEEGLAGANADTSGSPDTTNAKVATGTVAVADVDGEALSVTLGNPGAVLTSNGVAVTWTGAGTSQLVGSAGGQEVIRIQIDNNGNYTVTLSGPVDHANTAVEDDKSFNVTVTASDGDASTNGVLTVKIEDDSPIAAADVDSVTEDTAVTADGNVLTGSGGLDANATDGAADAVGADGHGEVVGVAAGNVGPVAGDVGSSVAGTYGSVVINADGSYTYTLNNESEAVQQLGVGDSVLDVFTYTMEDADGDKSTTTLTITVNGSNDAPRVGTGFAVVSEEGLAGGNADNTGSDDTTNLTYVEGTISVSDLDGDALTVTLGEPATALTSNGVAITWTGDGTNTLVGSAGGTEIIRIEIENDGDYAVTLSGPIDHADGSVEDDKSFNVPVAVSDGLATTDTVLSVTIEDDSPIANADADSVQEDTFLTADGNVITGSGGVDANATDGTADDEGADDHAEVVGAAAGDVGEVSGDVGATINGTYGSVVINANGSYVYTLNNANGAVQALDDGESLEDVFTYTIEDADGDKSTTTLTITINGTNDAPTIGNGTAVVSEEGLTDGNADNTGSDDTTNAIVATGTLTVADVDGDSLTVTLSEPVTALTSNGVNITWTGDGTNTLVGSAGGTEIIRIEIENDGDYTVTLSGPIDHADDSVEDDKSFNVTATVDDGTTTGTGTLSITIEDDSPIANADADSVTEDGPLVADGNVITGSGGDDGNATDGTADDTGADNHAEVVGAAAGDVGPVSGNVGATINGTYGTVVINANGSYTYTLDNANGAVQALDAGESLEDVFTYTIEDADGDASTTTLTITINGTDDIPTIGDGTAVVSEEGLPGGNADNTGSDDTTNAIVATGTLTVADVDGDALTVTLNEPVAALTSNGVAITWTGDGTNTLVGSAGGTEIIRIEIENDGDYTVTLSGPIDHADGTVEDDKTFDVIATVSDGSDSSDGTLTITIEDDSPIANADADSVQEDTFLTADGNVITGSGGVDANGTDGTADDEGADDHAEVVGVAAGDVGQVSGDVGSSVSGTYGSVVINANGSYVYTLNNANGAVQALDDGESLEDVFTYTIEDADGDKSTTTLTITINGTNDAPTIGDGSAVVSEEGLAGGNADNTGSDDTTNAIVATGTLTVADVDGDSLTVTLSEPATALTSNGVTITWTGDGTNTLVGSAGGTEIIRIEIENDGDYTVTLSGPIDHADGTVEDDKSFDVTATVDDGTTTGTGTLSITIEDDSPIANADADSVQEDTFLTADGNVITGSGGVDANGTDGTADDEGADDHAEVVGAAAGDVGEVSGDVGATINGTYGSVVINANGSYTYTLNNANGAVQALDDGESLEDVFTYTIEDADGDKSTTTLTITINGTNDAPTIGNGTAVVSEEGLTDGNADNTGSDDTTNAIVATGTLTVADVDGDSLTVTLSEPVTALTSNGVNITWTGDGTNTLVGSAGGTEIIRIEIENDGDYTVTLSGPIDHADGTVEDDKSFDVTATVDDGTTTGTGTLSITIEDDSPIANADADSVQEDTSLTADGNVITGSGGSDANATDGTADDEGADDHAEVVGVAAGDVGQVSGDVGSSVAGAYGTVVINANGSYTYTLNNANGAVQALDDGESLEDVFTYTIEDADGDKSTTTLTITINGTNDAPTIGDGTAVVSEEGLAGGNADNVGSDDTTNAIVATGTLTVADVDGDSLTVTLSEPVTALTSNGVNITWTGDGTNTLVGSAGGTEIIRIEIENDGDYTVTLSGPIDHADGTVEDDKSFDVTATVDDGTTTGTGTLSITIEDDSPIANADADSVQEDTSLTADGNVITGSGGSDANATDGTADDEGADDHAEVVGVAAGDVGQVSGDVGSSVAGAYGTVVINANGSYTYTLNNANGAVQALDDGESLEDVFTYTIEDADGDKSTTTLTITINGTNDAPTIGDGSAVVSEEGLTDGLADDTGSDDTTNAIVATGTLTVADVDGDSLTVTLSEPATALTSNGVTITWTGDGTNTLVGSAGGTEIIRIEIENDGDYTVTLSGPIDHADDTVEDDKSFDVTATVSDGTTTGTGTLSVTIEDDSPITFTPESTALINELGETVTGDLDVDANINNNVGADQPGLVQFANIDNGDDSGLTSGDDAITYWLSNDGQTLQGRTNSTNGTDGTLIIQIDLNQGAGTYSVEMFGSIDNGAGVFFDNLTSTSAGSTNYAGVGADDPLTTVDLLLSGSTGAGADASVNTNATAIGVANQSMNSGESLRIDFVSNLESGDAGATGFSYDGHVSTSSFVGEIPEVQGNQATTVSFKVWALDSTLASGASPDRNPADGFTGVDTPKTIVEVTVTDYLSGLSTTADISGLANGATQVIAYGISVTRNADGSITFSGVQEGDSYGFSTGVDDFNAVLVQALGSFDLGVFAIGAVDSGDPINLSYDLQLTDADGDSILVTDALDITVNPDLAPPIALDLNGDGVVHFVGMDAGYTFDYFGDGSPEHTAWVADEDGLLAIDLNGDGVVNDGSEIIFAHSGLTDLQGLAATYDTNHDGFLNADDADFSKFGVLQAGEFTSLSEAGIVSIQVTSDGISYTAAGGQVTVHGEAEFTWANGDTGSLADAAFAYSDADSGSDIDETSLPVLTLPSGEEAKAIDVAPEMVAAVLADALNGGAEGTSIDDLLSGLPTDGHSPLGGIAENFSADAMALSGLSHHPVFQFEAAFLVHHDSNAVTHG